MGTGQSVDSGVSCPACKVYDKWLVDKEKEIKRLNELVGTLQEEKALLETRLLTALRVIPPSNGNNNQQKQSQAPIPQTRTRSWEEKKKELEKLGRDKAEAARTVTDAKYWKDKAEVAAQKEGFEPPREIDFSDSDPTPK